MDVLRREEFDQVIRSGNDIIIFCYKENDAESTLGMKALETIERMYGKNFNTYIVNILNEPEIVSALGSTDHAEFICIKKTKIYSRKTGIIYSNEILELLK